jgi:hypothetical protein
MIELEINNRPTDEVEPAGLGQPHVSSGFVVPVPIAEPEDDEIPPTVAFQNVIFSIVDTPSLWEQPLPIIGPHDEVLASIYESEINRDPIDELEPGSTA